MRVRDFRGAEYLLRNIGSNCVHVGIVPTTTFTGVHQE